MKISNNPYLKLFALLTLLLNCNFSNAQFNDTLFFKSGKSRIVEIDTVKLIGISYFYINTNNNVIHTRANMSSIAYFKICDESDSLIFNSKEAYFKGVPGKQQDSLVIPKHTLTLSPFRALFLSPKIRYTYTFGDNMELAINVRANYYNPRFFSEYDFGYISAGIGLKFIPFYNKRYALGFDFTPTFVMRKTRIFFQPEFFEDPFIFPQTNFETITQYGVYMPGSVNLDMNLTKRLGIALDFGVGPVFFGNNFEIKARGNLGITYNFNSNKIITKPLLYHISRRKKKSDK